MSEHNRTVKIRAAHRAVEVPEGTTILDAALQAGVDYPHSCKHGRCGACKSRLISGEVSMDSHSRFALSETERQQGLILACRAQALSDLEVTWVGEETKPEHLKVEFQGRVIGKDLLTHDIVRLRIHCRAVCRTEVS